LSDSNLQAVVESFSESVVLHIGAYSSFILIGNRETYEKYIDKLSAKFQKQIEYDEHEFRFQLERAKRMKVKALESGDAYFINITETRLKECEAKYAAVKARYDLTTVTPNLRDRRVIDVFKRFDTGYGIKIDGWESGQFWTLDEWRAKHGI